MNASYKFEYGKVYGIAGKTGEGKRTLYWERRKLKTKRFFMR